MKAKNYRCEGAGPVPGGRPSVLPDWRVLSTCACSCSSVRSFIPQTLPSAATKARPGDPAPAPEALGVGLSVRWYQGLMNKSTLTQHSVWVRASEEW